MKGTTICSIVTREVVTPPLMVRSCTISPTIVVQGILFPACV
uniref:Uncharacterized protein n=1 Tax=Vitis vinifera TaxID=29760 RepID=F6I5P7_VITVI